jgi:hypothetical protein
MAFHNPICDRLEEACQAFYNARIDAGDLTLTPAGNVRIGFAPETLTGNYILFVSESAEAEEVFDGNWSAILRMEVVSGADGFTEVQHRQRFGEALSWFMTATMADDLSAAGTDFTAMFVIPKRQGKRIEGRKWISFQEFIIKCCGSSGV